MNPTDVIEKFLNEEYVNFIKNDQKHVEARMISDFWNESLNGKTIKFVSRYDANNTVTVRILKCIIYESFTEMLTLNDFKDFIPQASTIKEALDVYLGFFEIDVQPCIACFLEVVDY